MNEFNNSNKLNWVKFDDETVNFIEEENALQSERSYLLFYKKKDFKSSTIINLTYGNN